MRVVAVNGRHMVSGVRQQPSGPVREPVRPEIRQAGTGAAANTDHTVAGARGNAGGRTRPSIGPRWDHISRPIARSLRRLLLVSSGQAGAAVSSLVALWATVAVNRYSGWWIFEAVAGLVLIRLIYQLTRGPVPALTRHRIRKRSRWVLVDEMHVSVAFVAACFLMAWPVDYLGVTTFVMINLVLQLVALRYSRRVLRMLAARVYTADDTCFARRAVILGTGVHAQRVADMVLASPDLDTKLSGFLDYGRRGLWRYRDIPLIGHPDRLEEIITNGQVDAVFVAVEPEDIPRSRDLFNTAERMGVNVFVMPNVYYPTVARIRPLYVNGMPALIYQSAPESRTALFVKNALDKAAAAVGLVIVSPVMILAALLIKVESPGPVIFKQVRSGLNGRLFNLYKFRTMCADAEKKKDALAHRNEMSGPVFKIRKDPRVTTIGRLLRKFSVDELPQFFNVLTGDMSLVGPRPPLPSEVRRYQPWQHRKLSIKPGVTCLWQVNGRNRIDFDDWMRMDLEYIDTWSLWLDLKILLKTVPAVLKGTGV